MTEAHHVNESLQSRQQTLIACVSMWCLMNNHEMQRRRMTYRMKASSHINPHDHDDYDDLQALETLSEAKRTKKEKRV